MDGIVTVNGQIGKLWLCKRHAGHALGLRVKVQVEGMFIERLMLFRNAVAPELAGLEARQLCFAEGTTHDIECSICASTRTWWMGRNGAKRAQRPTYLAE